MGSCVRGGGATAEARGRQVGRFPQQRRLVTRVGGREVPCGPAHSGSFGEVGPRRGERRRGDTPPTPRAASGSARELFIHKKDKTPRGSSESEPQPPTRTPPSISPGHVPRLRRTGTELRGWQRVRSPHAGPASSGAGRPAAGEAGRTPERDLGLNGIRGAGVSLVCFGFRTATPSSVSLWWSRPWILHVLRGPGTGVPRGQGDRRSRRSDDLRIPFLPSRISLADCQSAPLSPLVFISSCLPLNTGVSPAPSYN